MNLFGKSAGCSDEERVTKVRFAIASLDRWRPWLVGLYLVSLVVYVCLLISVARLIQSKSMSEMIPVSWWGFALGLVIGALLGQCGYQIIQGFVILWPLGLRNERLMIRYHDELAALRASVGEEPPDRN
jgi:hypothetical protein